MTYQQKPPKCRPLVDGFYDPLDGAPIADGAMYCAPFCGGGCTRAEYEDALARGQAAADELGEGWYSKPSENLGWHARARKGKLTVHVPSRRPPGDSFMAGAEPGGILGRGATALEALVDMLENLSSAVKDRQARLDAVVAEVEG